MSSNSFGALCEGYVKKTYSQQGLQNIRHRDHILEILLSQHKLPKDGLDDDTIEFILRELTYMDSNNFFSNIGVGEREGRVVSSLVRRRHYGMSHGIGRSGDLIEEQPKAAGSSIMYKLTNKLVHEAFKIAGLTSMKSCLVLPLATGMSVGVTLRMFANTRPSGKYVLWPRIDQKSCFKAIIFAGLTPIVIEPLLLGGVLQTNIEAIKQEMDSKGPENIVAVLSTTSCFAPRQPDSIDEIAKLCMAYSVPHIVNNAYGIQSNQICKLINRASTIGRVDAVIQSTDKNFLVPVGGAVISSPNLEVINQVSGTYPGRASASSIIDLFITLLSIGESGFRDILSKRQIHFQQLKESMENFVSSWGGRILPSPANDISIGVELSAVSRGIASDYTFFGSMMFQREVSGLRVVTLFGKETTISGFTFTNWGAHCNTYGDKVAYFTVAAAIGMEDSEVSEFSKRLQKVMKKFNIRHHSSSVIDSTSSEVNLDVNVLIDPEYSLGDLEKSSEG